MWQSVAKFINGYSFVSVIHPNQLFIIVVTYVGCNKPMTKKEEERVELMINGDIVLLFADD